MSNRHETKWTVRNSVIEFQLPGCTSPYTWRLAQHVISNEDPYSVSKWMDERAVMEYREAFQALELPLKRVVKNDPHSRRLVLQGPGVLTQLSGDIVSVSCWLYTIFLSQNNKPAPKYHVTAHYRALDDDHKDFDAALQYAMAERIVGADKIASLTIIANDHHKYKE